MQGLERVFCFLMDFLEGKTPGRLKEWAGIMSAFGHRGLGEVWPLPQGR